mgnify:CR=1 FL=1
MGHIPPVVGPRSRPKEYSSQIHRAIVDSIAVTAMIVDCDPEEGTRVEVEPGGGLRPHPHLYPDLTRS